MGKIRKHLGRNWWSNPKNQDTIAFKKFKILLQIAKKLFGHTAIYKLYESNYFFRYVRPSRLQCEDNAVYLLHVVASIVCKDSSGVLMPRWNTVELYGKYLRLLSWNNLFNYSKKELADILDQLKKDYNIFN